MTSGRRMLFGAGLLVLALAGTAAGETMLQYFNTSWREMTDKMPELAEAGYSSIWIPPPTKGSGGLSVGYDLWDPFDLCGRNQRSTVAGRYGTEAELLNMIEVAHRFGIRVYADNIMNHRAFDIPGYNESTPVDVYPGMAPEDFHLRKTEDGFYRKWDNCRDWNDAWQVMHLGLSDLIDIAHETPNQNHGFNEGDWHEKPSFVRHPNNPEFYDHVPNVGDPGYNEHEWGMGDLGSERNEWVGFGPDNGITEEFLQEHENFYKEDVGAYLCRAVRWKMAVTKLDGLRLDAVKHVPDYFYGEFGADASSRGYIGNIQWQFNMTRGFNDWENHRDSNFNEDMTRNDALVFGEHLGQPPGYDGYISAGMRLVDNDLRNQLNWRFSAGDLWGYDHADAGGFHPAVGIMHAQSHDNDYVDRKELHHAYYYLRKGIGLLYTDGNYHAETLGESGGAFPRWANTAFLGQWGQTHVPELLKIHENFARYDHIPMGTHWDGASIAWERGGTHPWNTVLVVFNSKWEDWITIPTQGSFPDDAYLYNYARTYQCYFKDNGSPADYVYADDIYNVNQPNNSYTVWGYKNPDPSELWPGSVITIYDNGQVTDTVTVERKDGPDGDSQYNPYGLPNRGFPDGVEPTPYTYRVEIPRVTTGTNVVFSARADGSTENIMLRLNGGMDLNGEAHEGGDLRDNPPGVADDTWLGYENVNFVQRIWPEKYAAVDTQHCKIGPSGATSYEAVIGQGGVTDYAADAGNDYGTSLGELSWVYHDPMAQTDVESGGGGGGGHFGPVNYLNAEANGAFNLGSNGGHFNGTGKYGNDIGANAIGFWSDDDGFAGYTANFPAALDAGQTLSFDFQHNWIGNDKSLGWALVDNAGNDVLQWIFVGGTTNYEIRGIGLTNASGLAWNNTAQSASIAFSSATDVALTINGTENFNWTLGAPATKLRFWSWEVGAGSNHNYYANSIEVDGDFPGSGGGEGGAVTNQYYVSGSDVVIWAKTPKQGGVKTYVYYTTDGSSWPEGAGGGGAFAATKVAEGEWQHTGSEGTTDWWKYVLPKPSNGTTLRYKIGAARRQGEDGNGWETVWPGSGDAIYKKLRMLSEWNTDAQNLKTKGHHKHNDYNSWTEGLPDGFHLITAKAMLNRNDGAAVFNTFKQPFYLDTETPRGYFEWPENENAMLGGSEYGVVVRTDPTVREVWYRIEDSDADNDDSKTGKANGNGDGFEPYTDANGNGQYDTGEPFTDLDGNGLWTSNGIVSWQKAYRLTPSDMSQEYPQAWGFNYANLPTGGTATIRVRLREWSSAERTAWTNAGLTEAQGHFTELVRTVKPKGDAYRLYFDWPDQDGMHVEAGWSFRVKYSGTFAADLNDEEALALFTIKLNSAENGGDPADGVILSHDDIDIQHDWDWPNENTITFTMPNMYNGDPNWLHGLEVKGVRAGYPTLRATRKVTTSGELLPSIIINEPPEFGSDGKPHVIILQDLPAPVIATNPLLRQTRIQLLTDPDVQETGIYFTSPQGYTGELELTGTNVAGSTLQWNYTWSNLTAGTYRFTAWVRDAANKTNTASRTARLQLMQVVDMSDPSKLDHDDDGMLDAWETTLAPLPPEGKPNPEFWTQEDVHAHYAHGKSLPHSPDSDGDGLPDALELGFRVPSANTDTNTDTNADGWPNFLPDLDPPFYNTLDNYDKVPGVDSQSKGGDRSKRLWGSTTDPTNPDTDYDGIPDGLEDANRNGWVDGDGDPIQPGHEPGARANWPNGRMDTGELWLETDPNNPDTDGDGLSDGYGEDKNFNGYVDIGLADGSGNVTSVLDNASVPKLGGEFSRQIDRAALFAAYPNAVYLETDPLLWDTDGDGLPDGWEVRYGLDPLDSGVIGARSLRTGLIITSDEHGADGDPDGDGFTNLQEFLNGTNPREFDFPTPPPVGEGITIGRGPEIGVINGKTNYQEFLEWTLDDLIALDHYNDGGSQAVDIYRRWDGFDSSRDLVAFYMRDGGTANDKLYFRVDFHDLQPYAEESALNIYVVLDFNSPGTGEAALPDEVDTRTDMKWEAVVAVYDSQNGNLYVDTDPVNNTVGAWDDLAANGVVIAPGGFLGAYFNSELDACEFAIRRSALTDLGWNGDASKLNFQVFTTKDGTCNSCNGGKPGPGDIGGRSDITDSIRNDWIASDYWRDQDWISQNGVLTQWIGKNADNDIGKSAKIALLAHGNQAIQPASVIHDIVNDGAGAGYQRPVQSHQIFQKPLNLHITPTLASALEWAEVKDGGPEWRSGPGLNEMIREEVASGNVVLMASTYSDHAMPYFTPAFNQDNVNLASDTLGRIYGATINSNSVFWAPERLLDGDVFAKITNMGFRYTLIDQNSHVFRWFGRQDALGNAGYRINKVNGVNCFVINTAADSYRFSNHDGGLPMPMRELFSRRARSGEQNQISTIFTMWEEFSDIERADGYDRNLRWMANRPWIQLVSLEDIAAGKIELPWGQQWDPIDRGDSAGDKLSHDWINHANNEDYDNWYEGSWRHEGLNGKKFEIRPGVSLPTAYGMTYTGGIISNTWTQVAGIANADVKRLAREVLHASVFETAFHNEDNHDLTQWSFGGYINPASDHQDLIDFARHAQSQSRLAGIYSWVDSWATAAPGLSITTATSLDVDQDGEAEYVLYNQHVAALFERIGGRMIAAWHRDGDGRVRQMIGNLASYPGTATEQEGTFNATEEGHIGAYRTSALKDWYAGTTDYINDLYTITDSGSDGWKLTSSDGKISKTVTLAPAATNFHVSYTIDSSLNGGELFVRSGFSPNLSELLVRGQRGLADTIGAGGGTLSLTSSDSESGIVLEMTQGVVNTDARDDHEEHEFDSVPMRNQAQTRQVEMTGAGSIEFTLGFYAEDASNDPPEIEFDPAGPYTNAVGTTNQFTVSVSDPDGDEVNLWHGPLPVGAIFNTETLEFSWHVKGMGTAGTTNQVHFMASDGIHTVTNTASIVVPWDANGNGIPDDWEFFHFGNLDQTKDGDADNDGFSNFAEWVAGTNPTDEEDYIGWEWMGREGDAWKLTFKAKSNGIYHIEAKDKTMRDGETFWYDMGTVTNTGGDASVEWTDDTGTHPAPEDGVRFYRIRIPKYQP
ncbi:MAG: hypothetical protein GX803_00585 [Lentisphaerae bacterium]|nr:hypothetical protein [Lentisphaerota bacterium]